MAIISFKDVSFQYPNGFSAIENITFDIEQGEKIAIIGQNGAGKTTTVKMMNGLLKPTKGSVIIDNMNTKDYTTAQLSKVAGYVFQNPDEQIFHNTVREEIEYGPKNLGFDSNLIEEKTMWAANICGLVDKLEENPYNLPLSIRKFVTIASVLAMNEKILVLDEPTAGQDLNGIKCLEKILIELEKMGVTIITITHDMEFVVNNFQKVFVMAHKNLLKIGSALNIFKDEDLLNESMLRQPYISNLIKKLDIREKIISHESLIEYLINKN